MDTEGDAQRNDDFGILSLVGITTERIIEPVLWPAGNSKLVVQVAIENDRVAESVEYFKVEVKRNGVVQCTATVLIIDDDGKTHTASCIF